MCVGRGRDKWIPSFCRLPDLVSVTTPKYSALTAPHFSRPYLQQRDSRGMDEWMEVREEGESTRLR